MFIKTALAALLLAFPAMAHEGIHLYDPYARVIGGNGTVYLTIVNKEHDEDVLLGATASIAGMAMLMTSAEDANGVMKMHDAPDGFAIAPGETLVLKPVSNHLMLSDIAQKLKPGDTFQVTLTFRNVGDVTLTVPIDNKRTTDPGMGPTPYDGKSGLADGMVHDAPGHDMGDMDMTAPAP